jgi:hypothetical protein
MTHYGLRITLPNKSRSSTGSHVFRKTSPCPKCTRKHRRYQHVNLFRLISERGGGMIASTARRKSGPPSEGFILGPLPASLRARHFASSVQARSDRTTRESKTYKGRRSCSPPLEGELEGVKNFCRNALGDFLIDFTIRKSSVQHSPTRIVPSDRDSHRKISINSPISSFAR